MRCPGCKNKVLQKSGSIIRLRAHGPVEFHPDGICRIRCHWCKQPVELCLRLTTDEPLPDERYILTKGNSDEKV